MRYPRIATLLLLSFAGAFLSGCHDEEAEPTEPQAILTLQVDKDYGLKGDRWIFASDENGEILDVQPYEDGQTVTLMSAKRPAKINVTMFNYAPFLSEGMQHIFTTWADVASGTTFHFETVAPPSTNLERTKVNLDISNFNTTVSQLGISNGYSVGYTASLALGHLEMDLSLYGAPSDLMFFSWHSEVPVYHLAPDVKPNDVIDLDFGTDFTPFPHQFKLDFPGKNDAIILGYDAKKSRNITLLETFWLTEQDHPIIGYLDGYDSYNMRVTNLQANGYSTSYQKKGAIDYSFDMPTYTFSITNSTLQNFSFNFSHDYTYRSTLWQHIDGKEYTWWTVNAASGYTVKGLSIPSPILTKYPQLDVNKLEHASTNFSEVIKGRSYQETLPGATIAKPDDTYEIYVYTVK